MLELDPQFRLSANRESTTPIASASPSYTRPRLEAAITTPINHSAAVGSISNAAILGEMIFAVAFGVIAALGVGNLLQRVVIRLDDTEIESVYAQLVVSWLRSYAEPLLCMWGGATFAWTLSPKLLRWKAVLVMKSSPRTTRSARRNRRPKRSMEARLRASGAELAPATDSLTERPILTYEADPAATARGVAPRPPGKRSATPTTERSSIRDEVDAVKEHEAP